MALFVAVVALLFVQVWGAHNPIHRDAWLDRWLSWLKAIFPEHLSGMGVAAIFLPALALLIVLTLLEGLSIWLSLPFSVMVLLYSFGRGGFGEPLRDYSHACLGNDFDSARRAAEALNSETEDIQEDDWRNLHRRTLDRAVYVGFERMFAVLFWFFLIGPTAAFIYRVTALVTARGDVGGSAAKKLLWLMEWPAARVMGLSFAITGNFVHCLAALRECALCLARPTEVVLAQTAMGALSITEEVDLNCDVTRRELSMIDGLYQRTLWLWFAVVAIIVLLN